MDFPNPIFVELKVKKRKKEKDSSCAAVSHDFAIACDKFVVFNVRNCVVKFDGLYSCDLVGEDFFDGFGL